MRPSDKDFERKLVDDILAGADDASDAEFHFSMFHQGVAGDEQVQDINAVIGNSSMAFASATTADDLDQLLAYGGARHNHLEDAEEELEDDMSAEHDNHLLSERGRGADEDSGSISEDGFDEDEDVDEAIVWNGIDMEGAIAAAAASLSVPLVERTGNELNALSLDVEAEEGDEDDEENAFGLHEPKKAAKMRRQRVRRSKLNPDAMRQLGDANQAFLGGEYDRACKVLHEVIRLCPSAFEPYHMLGIIHEEQHDIQKAILFYMVAAHLKPKDVELWKRLAHLSRESNLRDQAVFCYSKALKVNPDDQDALWDRSIVCLEMNDIPKAAEGYARLLRLRPFDLNLAQDVARIYVELKDVPKAISVLEAAMLKDQTHGNVSENFTFDHLNLVVELYIMAKDFSKAFDTLVSIGTHIISRQHSSLGGAEFSSGNGSPQNPSVVDHLLSMLPLDLRVKLGICLIHQGELERAARHIAALDSFKFEMVADLHRDVAEAYIATRNHAAAMTLYDRLVEHEVFDMPETWAHLAECCRVLGHHERAVELYSKLSELFPDQKEIKLTLAELYDAMGDEQRANAVRGELRARKEATSIVHSLMRKPLLPALPVESRTNGTVMRKTHVDNDKGASSTAALDTNDDTLFVPDIRAASSATRSGKNQEVAERLTKAKLLEHREKYNKAKELWCKMNEDVADCGDMEEFRLVARSLLTDFHTCERFFNPHRLRPFKPPSNKKRGRKPAATKKSAFNEAVDQALSDYVSDTDGSDLSVGKGRAKAASSFRAVPPSDGEHAGSSDSYFGLKFSEWFMINAWFALFLLRLAKIVREERVDPFIVDGAILKTEEVNHLARGWYHEAAEILSKAEKASIFHYDFERSSQLHLLRLGIAFMDDDLDGMYEIVRWILSHYNVSKSACSVYASAYPYGQRNLAIFSSPSSQKFFMRHIKETESVHGLVMAGHIFAASKSFSHALLCFARAWKLQPDDAQINLYLGLTYLHRATQRNTDNRHSNITHAFTFLFRYKKSRAVYAARLSITDRTRQLVLEQEALFNVARAFHTIGLLHFATTFYEDCLRYCDGHDQPLLAECGLQRECAYNLHLICVQSASPEQAKRVLQEHCTV